VNVQKRAAAADRRETREKLLAMKPRAKWLAEAQRVCNQWILIRDAGKPCVSCGRHHKGKVDAGHYIAAGESEALTFSTENLHAQCSPCNTKLHGNLVRFRAELLRRIGPAEVERLETCTEKKVHSIAELREIRDYFRALVRAAVQ
jgi:hypothetical protein